MAIFKVKVAPILIHNEWETGGHVYYRLTLIPVIIIKCEMNSRRFGLGQIRRQNKSSDTRSSPARSTCKSLWPMQWLVTSLILFQRRTFHFALFFIKLISLLLTISTAVRDKEISLFLVMGSHTRPFVNCHGYVAKYKCHSYGYEMPCDHYSYTLVIYKEISCWSRSCGEFIGPLNPNARDSIGPSRKRRPLSAIWRTKQKYI